MLSGIDRMGQSIKCYIINKIQRKQSTPFFNKRNKKAVKQTRTAFQRKIVMRFPVVKQCHRVTQLLYAELSISTCLYNCSISLAIYFLFVQHIERYHLCYWLNRDHYYNSTIAIYYLSIVFTKLKIRNIIATRI